MSRKTFTSERTPDMEPDRPNPLAGEYVELDGIRFNCEGRIDLLDVSELSALAVMGTDTRSPQGLAMLAQYLQLAFGPAEYLRLKMHCREYNTPHEVIFGIVAEITGAVETWAERETGRPTERPPSYSDGQPDRAEQISRVVSLAGGSVTPVGPGWTPPGSTPETDGQPGIGLAG
jgi:hypothetical protein